ncbi:MAG: phosphate acyltransferase, partial [Ignavibacteria bacterium]
MANPDPEITYPDAKSVRDDIIMATGRSDYPNQVNNVLGFPFIFRGALDVRASTINNEMKIAAAMALAKLAKEDIPDSVIRTYGGSKIEFGKEYIIPKPFDPRVLLWEAPAVAEAAMFTGVAKNPILDFEEYKDKLEARLGKSREIMRFFIHKAQHVNKKIVFPEGEESKILRAAQIIIDEGIAKPVLIGDKEMIVQNIVDLNLHFEREDIEIIEPALSPNLKKYTDDFFELRKRKGVTYLDAKRLIKTPNIFGMMMVRSGDADGLISGLTQHYPDTVKPALQIIGKAEGTNTVAGMYMMIFKNQRVFIADATVNINPNAEQLAEIALLVADKVKKLGVTPRIAMLSFSNFGSTKHPYSDKVRVATEIIKKKRPDLVVEGEMMADTALNPEMISEYFPFSDLKEKANVLICPDLTSANIAYKLLACLGSAVAIGPILLGIKNPVYLLGPGNYVDDIVNITAMAVYETEK